MKIVALPGVGFHTDEIPDCYLFLSLKYTLQAEICWYNWTHNLCVPQTNLGYQSLREFSAEVILDFQMVIKNIDKIHPPEADYYIGHSAGSIICLYQKIKNCITFGCPAILVEDIVGENPITAFTSDRKVLNIVNRNDFLAYPVPLPNVENLYISESRFNPVTAHYSYWNSKTTASKIISQIRKWEDEKLSKINLSNNIQVQ